MNSRIKGGFDLDFKSSAVGKIEEKGNNNNYQRVNKRMYVWGYASIHSFKGY